MPEIFRFAEKNKETNIRLSMAIAMMMKDIDGQNIEQRMLFFEVVYIEIFSYNYWIRKR